MRYIKGLAIFTVIFVILTCFSPAVLSDSNEDQTPRRWNIIDKLRLFIYVATQGFVGLVPWAALRLTEPKQFIAEPSEINLDYLDEKTEITIGMRNRTTEDWELLENIDVSFLFPQEDYHFDLELPEDLPKEYFYYSFYPQSLATTSKGELKTTLTIIPRIPKDAVLPKTLILRVNASTYVTGSNLYIKPIPPKTPNKDSWIQWIIGAPIWFLASVFSKNPFGILYSGKRTYDTSTYVEIMVKLDRYHLAEIEPTNRVNMGSDEIVSIPVEINNHGSHLDTFNFKVSVNKKSDLVISPPPAITLEPNEKGKAIITVASPPRFDDPGTLHSITLEAYSVYDPDKEIFSNTVTIFTKGIHISEIGILYLLIFVILIAFIAALVFIRKKRIFSQICKKPDKPWEIPEENKNLEKLKQKDKKKYKETLQTMQEEYKSSLLWYKFYCESILQKRRLEAQKGRERIKDLKREAKEKAKEETKKKAEEEAKEKIKEVTIEKKKEEIQKIKELKPIEPEKEEILPEEEITEEIIEPIIDEKAEMERRRKEQVLLRIKRDQEKQKRKLGRTI